jgi:hypothetical protein
MIAVEISVVLDLQVQRDLHNTVTPADGRRVEQRHAPPDDAGLFSARTRQDRAPAKVTASASTLTRARRPEDDSDLISISSSYRHAPRSAAVGEMAEAT